MLGTVQSCSLTFDFEKMLQPSGFIGGPRRIVSFFRRSHRYRILHGVRGMNESQRAPGDRSRNLRNIEMQEDIRNKNVSAILIVWTT